MRTASQPAMPSTTYCGSDGAGGGAGGAGGGEGAAVSDGDGIAATAMAAMDDRSDASAYGQLATAPSVAASSSPMTRVARREPPRLKAVAGAATGGGICAVRHSARPRRLTLRGRFAESSAQSSSAIPLAESVKLLMRAPSHPQSCMRVRAIPGPESLPASAAALPRRTLSLR